MTLRDKERYSRQILFHGMGELKQQKLLDARVVIAGCGALGTFQAAALARAGIGNLRIVDRDYVELSNLQRQWLFDENDAEEGLPKAVAAARHLSEINHAVQVEPIVADISPANIHELFENCSLILDGTDNFETRYLLNDYAVEQGVPWIYGAAVGSYGLTMPVVPGETACLKCVYPEPPSGAQPTCETAGVLGPITSLIASLQTAAAMKLLCGEPVARKITMADVWTGDLRQIAQPERDPACPACALGVFEHLDGSHRAPISLCGRNAVQIHENHRTVNLHELASRLSSTGEVRANDFALRFEAPPYLLTVFPDGRAIIKGTTDTALARSLYARYVGA